MGTSFGGDADLKELVRTANSKNNSFSTQMGNLKEMSSLHTFRGRDAGHCIKNTDTFSKDLVDRVLKDQKACTVDIPRAMDPATAIMGEVDLSLLITRISNNWIDVY